MNALNRIDDALARFEGWALVLLVMAMTGLAFFQVFLRNFLQTGLVWADPLNRHLVLWVGFLGASLATKRGKHITIDVLSRIIPPALKLYIDIIIAGFGIAICGILTHASIEFLKVEMGTTLFLDLPTWIVLSIIPAGFALITLRFLLHFFRIIVTLFTRDAA